MECRPVHASEMEAFVALMCRAFKLEAARTRGALENDPLHDLNRKWALFVGEKMCSILTLVPLEFGWGRAFGIAGVATDPADQRQGYAKKLMLTALDSPLFAGSPAFLFAENPLIYGSIGFDIVDQIIEGDLAASGEPAVRELLTHDEVALIYDSWALGDLNRLRRDEARWQLWRWNLRLCTRWGDGYLCHEDPHVREFSLIPSRERFPVASGTSWIGLKSMTERYQIPIELIGPQMSLMARGVTKAPEMFMTDQF